MWANRDHITFDLWHKDKAKSNLMLPISLASSEIIFNFLL